MRPRVVASALGVLVLIAAVVVAVGALQGKFFVNPTVDPGEPIQVPASAVSTLVEGLENPWGLDFLPDGTALVTERNRARIVAIDPNLSVTPVRELPQVVARGEGGLLGLAVSPNYAQDRWIYTYYTAADDNRISRWRLGETTEEVIFSGIPKSGNHNGGRIKFGPDGMLYAGTGDAGDRGRAQDRDFLGGKILRLTPDGQPAPGNPVEGSPVYSLGHRNVQGLAWDSAGHLFASEFGQNRYDELNRIEPNGNYGWPLEEGMGDDRRYVNPVATWSTSDASPSGIAILDDRVWIACLRGEKLYRIGTDGQGAQALLADTYGRLRDVVVAPDGSLWILTSNRDGRGTPAGNDDRIIRLDPSQI